MRIGVREPTRLPLEVLQQLYWWFIRPLRWRGRSLWAHSPVPRKLSVQACWLNSYRPSELAWWWALGVRTWEQVSRHHPESLVGALHAERRRSWPDQCRPALRLLSDKAALLASSPACWTAPYLVLPPQPKGGSVQQHEAPEWWTGALRGSGVVLKPQLGHAGRAVMHFWWTDAGLRQQALFRRLPAGAPVFEGQGIPDPQQLFEHWQRLCHSQEAALAAPYLSHSAVLPQAEPAVVVRVITAHDTLDAPIEIRDAWLEVPLGEGPVAFCSTAGDALPRPGQLPTTAEQALLDRWQELLRAGLPSCVEACLEASITMHSRLPPIDQVAWDWIPAEPEPRLLEGNGGFGLLVPQLFRQLTGGAGEALQSSASL